MTDLIVQRGTGDVEGAAIVDSLLSESGVAVARGTMEIDKSTSYVEVQLTALHKPTVLPGTLVSVADAADGTVWVGKVISKSISLDGSTLVDTVTIWRPYA